MSKHSERAGMVASRFFSPSSRETGRDYVSLANQIESLLEITENETLCKPGGYHEAFTEYLSAEAIVRQGGYMDNQTDVARANQRMFDAINKMRAAHAACVAPKVVSPEEK